MTETAGACGAGHAAARPGPQRPGCEPTGRFCHRVTGGPGISAHAGHQLRSAARPGPVKSELAPAWQCSAGPWLAGRGALGLAGLRAHNSDPGPFCCVSFCYVCIILLCFFMLYFLTMMLSIIHNHHVLNHLQATQQAFFQDQGHPNK